MPRAIIATDRQTLAALAARIDGALGYPRDGVDVGGGIHAPASRTRTLRHAEIRAHPAQGRWAYPVDDRVEALLTGPERAAVLELPADWFPEPLRF